MAEIATAIASEAAKQATELVCEFISPKISYVFKYQSYVKKPKKQAEELRSRRQDVEANVDVAERQGEEIYNEVKDWLRGVEGFMVRVEKLVDDEDKAKRRCFKGLCPDLMKRYRLSKEAEEVAEDGAKLLGKGNFPRVSHPPILRRTESIFVGKDYESFDSRESNFQDIMEALKDSTINMIGVHGMGGVGKTTLVKKVSWKAKEDNLFDEVVFAEVTETQDLKQFQADIAGQLDMVFRDQESLSGRANQLRHRLKKAKRILVIIDNIWEKIDLKVVGIPFSYDDKGSIHQDRKESNDEQVRCTIVLTARTLNVLDEMKTQKNVSVEPLADDDARNLFGNIVGDLPDKRNIAAEIIEKCAGLPLAITTIANALKGKSDSIWRDALHQLKSSNPRCVPGMNNSLYSTIELSYALLNSEEAKSLLLLCALFNNEHVSLFLLHGIGLGLFKDVYTIKDARNRIKSLIDYLEDSSLLLKGNNDEMVKMHDVVHLVVASIAKEKRMFNIQDGNGFKEVLVKGTHKDSIAISLPYGDIDGLPERVKFPNLELFTLSFKKDNFLQIPNHFFEGMKELKVLYLDGVRLLPLPSSFLCLTNLQSLQLANCTLGDITMIGELRNLEVLCFISCEFEQLPESFRQLTQLKFLELANCSKLRVITPEVIASLSRLEELYINDSFDQWDVEGRNNASLAELKRLSQLNTLCIHIPNVSTVQQDFIPENLEKYNVHIGDAWEWSYEYETSRTLRLKFNGSLHLRHGVEILVKKAKYLYLDQLEGVDILWKLDREGFPQLKHLSVQNSSKILYIVNSMRCNPSNEAFPVLESLFLTNLSNMEKICCDLVDAKSFSKLRIIKVKKCDRLRYLFSSSMAENISQIQEIEVTDCKELKEIFGQESADHVDEDERNCKVEFTQLHSLVLQCLPQFISFGLKVILPRLENLKLSSIKIENMWLDQPQPMSSSFQFLKSLTVEECDGLKFLFSSSMVKSFMQLQKLVICNCKSMEAVILDLEGLDVQDKIIDVGFHNLETLTVEYCRNMKSLFPVSIATGLLQLKELGIYGCWLEEIVANDEEVDETPRFLFPQLTSLDLCDLPELKHFYLGTHTVECPKLKSLSVSHCEKINLLASEFSKVQNTDQESQPFLVLSEKVMPNLESMNLDADAFKLQTKGPLEGFCKLKKLQLQGLNDESILFFYGFLKRLYNLESLTLGNYSLKELFPYEIDTWKEDSQMHPFLPNLRTLNVYFCHNLTHLLPSSTPFTNLTTLFVALCYKLVNIFTCSIVKSLVQLTEITIKVCTSLKEVIVGEFDQTEDEIVFCQLKTLNLFYLPNLTCFCSTTCAFKFPCLEQVTLTECPKLKIFTQGSLSTPKLNRVQRLIDINGEYVWKGDLNSTIQQMFIEMSPEASSSSTGVTS